jgi:hypothetical protein
VDGIIRRCVPEYEQQAIIRDCHDSAHGGRHVGDRTAAKVLQSGFYWPTLFKDHIEYIKSCDKCQRVGNIGRRNEMPMNYSLPLEPFDVWGFDFMGPFPASRRKHTHILVAVDYVTKWVEEIPTRSVDHATAIMMLKDIIFPIFGVPRYLITDGGSISCMVYLEKLWQSMKLIIESHFLIILKLVDKLILVIGKSNSFWRKQ